MPQNSTLHAGGMAFPVSVLYFDTLHLFIVLNNDTYK